MAHGHFQFRGLPVCVLGDRDPSWWCRRPRCPSLDTPSALQSMCLVIRRDPSICIPQFSHLSVKWGAYARCIDMTDNKQVFSWEQFWLFILQQEWKFHFFLEEIGCWASVPALPWQRAGCRPSLDLLPSSQVGKALLPPHLLEFFACPEG